MGCSSSTSHTTAAEFTTTPPAKASSAAPQPRRPQGKFEKHFQVKLDQGWKDYEKDEDVMITRAFLIGQKHCRFTLRGICYEVDFQKMTQKNVENGKERTIRPPPGMKAPKNPLLPAGPTIVITVRAGQPGKVIKIEDSNNVGQQVEVAVPKDAKVGTKVAVPVPAKGEKPVDVVKRQQGMGLAAKGALGATAAVVGAGAVVGGVVLGDHLTGGGLGTEDMAADAGDAIADAAADAADFVADAAADAGDAIADAAADVGDAIGEAAADAGRAIAEATVDAAPHVLDGVEDAAEWAEGAGEDAAEWFADMGDTLGDTVMDLF
mmetsp:Transcript_62948/g.117038  ORF Transcript_62948/g.117038 Transcript_62948/m.117038 type:complete len:321 (-) Transcript_62948:264-1226(-)